MGNSFGMEVCADNLDTRARDLSESVHGPTLGVRFPKAKLNTLSTAAELVEHHSGRARVHGVVPIEPADRRKRAILVVDTNILNLDPLPYPLLSRVLVPIL
jgi:hypothetical protein